MQLINYWHIIKAKFIRKQNCGWLFTSFYGDYADSPRAISELLHELHPEINIWWILKDDIKDIPSYIHKVSINSFEAEKIRHSAEVIVDNIYGENAANIRKGIINKIKKYLLVWMRKSRGQKVYTTWHGIPLKCLGRDEVNSKIDGFISNDITIFVNSKFEHDIMQHETFGKVEIKDLGMPRNDYLFSNEFRLEAKKKLGINEEKKILLFAPTFRRDIGGITANSINKSGISQLHELDIKRILKILSNRYGGEWVFICRFHSQVSEKVDWTKILRDSDYKIMNGNELSDMTYYLACADILMTDASSCMFDFMLTKRPCFLYFPDIEHYQNVERGLYMSIENLPFPLATNPSQLYSNISNFDKCTYVKAVDSLQSELKIIDDGRSTIRIIDYILHDIE